MMVRHATLNDFPAISRMARDFHASTAYQGIQFDEASCYLLFTAALESRTVFVSENGEVNGFILGLPFPCPLNRMVTMVSELAWWVDPEYRNTSAGVRLLQSLERAAKDHGSISLTMICLESLEPDKIQGVLSPYIALLEEVHHGRIGLFLKL